METIQMNPTPETHEDQDSGHSVYFNPDRTVCSWINGRSFCRIQTANPKIAAQIRTWSFVSPSASGVNCPLRVFTIPRLKWRWVLKGLGIQGPGKKPRRVVHGIKLGRQGFGNRAESRSQLEINGFGDPISLPLAEEAQS